MMSNYLSLLFVAGLIGFAGCKSETINTNQTPAIPSTTNPIGSADDMTPDSIDAYRPATFGGSSNTTLQYPFGLANQPGSAVRLQTVLYNGKLIRTYQYDEQARLKRRTDYYTDGGHIREQYTYNYGARGLAQTTVNLNKDIDAIERVPATNDLRLGSTITYSLNAKTQAWLEKNVVTQFAQYNYELGNTHSQLGFDAKGKLVWEETVDYKGKPTHYTLYRRNQAGNIVFYREAFQFNQWSASSFTYDDKPNPFYTTGDSEPIDLLGFTVVSPNNITLQQVQGRKDTWRYVHTYRPDAYPSQTKIYNDEKLDSTLDYTYNQ